jgi:hypothetical protein
MKDNIYPNRLFGSDFGDLRKIDHIKLNEKINHDHIKQYLLLHTQSGLAELRCKEL